MTQRTAVIIGAGPAGLTAALELLRRSGRTPEGAPAIRPIVFLVLVLATVNGFLMLDLIYILTMGGPGNDTTTISWLGFQTAFSLASFNLT